MIGRLVLLSGPRRQYCSSRSISFTVSVSDEFHEILTLYADERVRIMWIDNDGSSIGYTGVLNGMTTLKTPTETGLYDLCIEMANTTVKGVILPLLYKGIEIVSSVNKGYVPAVLESFRIVECNHKKYYIKENYGQTLGSHIYDSALVMLSYLSLHLSSIIIPKDGYILELGSGTGVIGICMADLVTSISNKILLTDKCTQLDLIDDNITRNNATRCSVVELDWSSTQHIQELLAKSSFPSVIIASDVLYAKDHIDSFFQCVAKLHDNDTAVLIAQKLRLNMHLNVENGSMLHGFTFVKVHEMFDVVVWSLQKT